MITVTHQDQYIGLNQLCETLNNELGYSFNIYDVVYFIRHVCIAVGCKNGCLHCFSDSPNKISQTELGGFSRIIKEIGNVVDINKKDLSFFHLGAANDPAYVKDYYKYLEIWRNAMPHYQMIKVFTHGWNLKNDKHRGEFEKFLGVLQSYNNIKVVISFDSFSRFAQLQWNDYIENTAKLLKKIINTIGKERVRMEVFYTPERLDCSPEKTLEYWRSISKTENVPSIQQIIKQIDDDYDIKHSCSSITKGALKVFDNCGLTTTDLIDMSRDCDSIFSAGRGKQFFEGKQDSAKEKGLEIQENRVLYSLKDYSHKYDGVIINPDGTCQIVDYHGYKVGKYLNNGNPVIPYMSII